VARFYGPLYASISLETISNMVVESVSGKLMCTFRWGITF